MTSGERDTPDERLSLAAIARRAGVSAEMAAEIARHGVIDAAADGRFTEGAVRRFRIVDQLVRGGLPLEGLAEGVRQGWLSLDFVDSPAYDRFAGHAAVTFRELSQQSGVSLEVLLAMREASGSAQPDPDDLVREIELEMVPALVSQLEFGIDAAVVERTLRAVGDSVRRIAEIEADWWAAYVSGPILAAGGTTADIDAKTGRFATELAPRTDQLLVALYHAHQTNAWMKNIFEGAETMLARSGLHRPVDMPPAICFLDLTGYTRLTDERGDEAAAATAAELSRLVQRISSRHAGKPIKWLGDGVMFHFAEPGPGVVAALEMVQAAAASDLPRAHVGLHAGPILFQEGDYFGRTVNVAARIADYARQGEVLVSQEVVDSTGEVPGLRFDEIGPVELKGLAEPIRLHVAHQA